MQNIVQSVGQVSEIMADIAAASMEQSQGIGQINRAVIELDKVTHQNARLVQEAGNAADALKQQERNLAEAVDIFRLGTTLALEGSYA